MINGPESDDLPPCLSRRVNRVLETLLHQPARLAAPPLGRRKRGDRGRGPGAAADGLNAGLQYAKHELLVCVHQDVYLPEDGSMLSATDPGGRLPVWADRRGGCSRLGRKSLAEGGPATTPRVSPWASILRPFRPTAVHGAGQAVEGREYPLAAERIGWVVDRGRVLRDGPELPARVATLDELLLVVRRDSPLRFDPALGFHLYGADICLQAAERGLASWRSGALCHHNSRSIGVAGGVLPEPRRSSRANGATGCRLPRRA